MNHPDRQTRKPHLLTITETIMAEKKLTKKFLRPEMTTLSFHGWLYWLLPEQAPSYLSRKK